MMADIKGARVDTTRMDPPQLRKKHVANQKKKDKGPIFASQKHVRINLQVRDLSNASQTRK